MASVMTLNNNLELARGIVAEINAEIQSSHQIIDRIREMPPTRPEQLEGRISKDVSWDKFFRFLDYDVQRARVAEAVRRVFSEQPFKGSSENTICLVMTKFGKGDCGEMAILAQVKAAKFAHAVIVTAGSTPIRHQRSYTHGFVILLSSDDECRQIINQAALGSDQPSYVDDMLRRLPRDAVILDPFLKIACLAKDLFSAESDLLEYNRVWGIKHVWELLIIRPQSPIIAKIEHGVEAAFQKAKEILPSIKTTSALGFVLIKLADEAREILSEAFPGTKWKINKNEGLNIFLTCSEQLASEISSKLKSVGIDHRNSKVKDADDFCIMIRNPDMFKLRTLRI